MEFICERCSARFKIEAEKDDGDKGSVKIPDSEMTHCPLCGDDSLEAVVGGPATVAEAAQKGFDTIHTDTGREPPARKKRKT